MRSFMPASTMTNFLLPPFLQIQNPREKNRGVGGDAGAGFEDEFEFFVFEQRDDGFGVIIG